MFGRFAWFEHHTDAANDDVGPWPDPLASKRDDIAQNFNAVVSDTHSFGPTLINEFRLGANGQRLTYIGRAFMQGVPQQWGLPASHPPDLLPMINNGLASWLGQQWGYRNSVAWSAQDSITKIAGKHTLKIGAEWRLNSAFEDQHNPASGSFTFASALTGNPQTTQPGYGYATFLMGAVSQAELSRFLASTLRGRSLSAFVQDDWRVSRRLTLNFGLRYDYQQQPYEPNKSASNFDPYQKDPVTGLMGRLVFGGVDGYGGSFLKDNFLDFSPRFGFAWDITGHGATVVRGGYGMYRPYMFFASNFPSRDGFLRTSTLYNPEGNNTNFAAFRLQDGLPYPPTEPLGRKLGSNGQLGQAVRYQEANAPTPYSQQVSLGIQQQIGRTWLVDASYSGNFGHHFNAGGYDMNQLDPRHLALGRALQDRVPNPYAGIVPGALGATTITRLQSLQPFPYYNTVTVRDPRLGNFNYHSLVLSLEKRFSRGFTMLLSYTGGKLISDSIGVPITFAGNEQTTINNYRNGKFDRSLERSVDPSDVSQRAVLSLVYELPFGKGKALLNSSAWANRLLGGWQVNVIGTLQGGLPVVLRGANNFLADRPNSTGKSAALPRSERSPSRWFDTAQFVNPPEYTFGNVGRVLPDVRTPGMNNWDISAIKNTRLRESVSLQFRAEAFNSLNHVNLRAPNAAFVPGPDGRNRSGTFGVITDARDARIVQLALKVIF